MSVRGRRSRISGNYVHRARGAALIEAMISLVIMGSGIAALAGLQVNLSRGAESARHQTEAIQLAREKLEQLRTNPGEKPHASESDPALLLSTTAYQLRWHMGESFNQGSRPATIAVEWLDKANTRHQMSLSTLLSSMNPADSGALYFAGQPVEGAPEAQARTSHTALNALQLPTGETALNFGESNQYLLMEPTTGLTSKVCRISSPTANTGTVQLARQVAKADADGNCSTLNALVVSGFISRDPSLSDSEWQAMQSEFGLDTRQIKRTPPDTAIVQCQISNIRDARSGMVTHGFKAYLCIIPFTAQSLAGGASWSGKWLISGPASWQSPDKKYFVCRYEYLAGSTPMDANQRNVQPYLAVRLPIHQQNYRIAASLDAASTTQPVCPENMQTFSEDAQALTVGVLHQDCRSASNPSAFRAECPVTPPQ